VTYVLSGLIRREQSCPNHESWKEFGDESTKFVFNIIEIIFNNIEIFFDNIEIVFNDIEIFFNNIEIVFNDIEIFFNDIEIDFNNSKLPAGSHSGPPEHEEWNESEHCRRRSMITARGHGAGIEQKPTSAARHPALLVEFIEEHDASVRRNSCQLSY